VVCGLALPFAPVHSRQAEVSWPLPGHAAVSTTAVLAPYRPATLTVTAPCPVLRAAASRGGAAVTVLATGGSTDTGAGVLVRVDGGRVAVLVNARLVAQAPVPAAAPVPTAAPASSGAPASSAAPASSGGPASSAGPASRPPASDDAACGLGLHADQRGVSVSLNGVTDDVAGEPVPEVAAFRTDLDAASSAGLSASARTVNPFDSTPTAAKTVLIALQLLAAALALWLLVRWYATRSRVRTPAPARSRLVDGGVFAVLAGWAVIGPLSDDDGFVTMIARNSLVSGDVGNYYRWWNASESPFTLDQQIVALLSHVSLQPLWLRAPSTVMGATCWLVLSRAVLDRGGGDQGGVEPGATATLTGLGTLRVRLLLAVSFLVAWLPYNLGVRPEPYVALGATAVLALLLRGRGPAALGLATSVAALTVTASPSGLLVLAAAPVFARKIVRMLRTGAAGWGEVAGRLALLGAVGAVGLTVVFADQSLQSLATATRWHAEFSPSLPWYLEIQRYRYLLGEYQDGNALKRVPVLLCLALLPVVALLLAGRVRGDGKDGGGAEAGRDLLDRTAGRLAGCVAVGFALLWLTPSKWTLYFGSLAGPFAAFITVAAVLLVRRALEGRLPMRSALLGGGLVAMAAGLAFSGTNDWWQPALYAIPWAKGPIRPAGLPLDLPPLWAGAALAVAAVVWALKGRSHARRSLLLAPAALTAITAATALAVLLFSFAAAPVRRPAASMALANLARLGGESGCGLANQIEALPDVPGGVLTMAGGDDLGGFAAGAGWRSDRPPPDPPGVRASAHLWGSRVDGDPARTGRLVSGWFTLPALAPDQELAMTVSGRTGGGNGLTLEFGAQGAQAGSQVRSLGEQAPTDLPHSETPNTGIPDPPDQSVWRSVWLTPDRIPAGADRVRVIAVDRSSDPDGWLALTGPRLRAVVKLPDFLAANGPVLVNWPIAFLFPCIRNVVTVAHGIVGAPRAVLAPARRYDALGGQSLDPEAAGDFAMLRSLGTLGEVPTRIVGHPDLDWGSMQLADYQGAVRDGYEVRLSQVTTPGWVGDEAQIITESDRPGASSGHS
jgi:arabinosyltransferase C